MSIPSSQHWSATAYERNARFVPDLGAPLIDLIDPREGERILDLGCGDGVLTERIAQRGSRVVGVDSAPEFVAAARARGLEIDLKDVHRLPYHAAFDAVFSNAFLSESGRRPSPRSSNSSPPRSATQAETGRRAFPVFLSTNSIPVGATNLGLWLWGFSVSRWPAVTMRCPSA
jgi:SAM-dependent methyltransferase